MKLSSSVKALLLLGLFIISGAFLFYKNACISQYGAKENTVVREQLLETFNADEKKSKKSESIKPPKDVKRFRADSTTSSSVSLSWKKVRRADGYLLYIYDTVEKKWNRIANVTSTSYMVKNLSAGERYAFTIRSFRKTNGQKVVSVNRPTVRVFTLLPEVKGTQIQPFHDRIRITWDKIPQADGYIIYKYNSDSTKWERLIKIYADIKSFTLCGLDNNTKHAIAVKAFKKIGKFESYSESFEAVKTRTPAHSVTGLKVIATDTGAKVSWDETPGIDTYYVFAAVRAKWSLRFVGIPIATTTKTSYTFNDLKPGKKYRFYIAGKQTEKGYDVSSVTAVTLPRPIHLSAEVSGETVCLSWNERTEATDYTIYVKLPDSEWKPIGETDKLTYTFKNYDCDKYYVNVRSRINRNTTLLYSDASKICIQNMPYVGSIYSCGDSIALGKGANNYSYISQFAERHSMSLTNSAIGGATISSYSEQCDHIAQIVIDEITDKYDYIVLDGGLNDFYFSSPLGKITPKGTESFDMNTTCGALESMLYHIKKTCVKSKVYFVSVHKVDSLSEPNELGLKYNDYRKAINKICKKYGVTVIDCYNCGLDASYTYTKDGFFPNGDGIHPTEEGYEKFYLPQLEKTIKLTDGKSIAH